MIHTFLAIYPVFSLNLAAAALAAAVLPPATATAALGQ